MGAAKDQDEQPTAAPAPSNRWPFDRFPTLPRSEAELKTILKGENYPGTMSLANKLAVELRLDASLRSTHLLPLLKELLATAPLAPTIPMLRRPRPATTEEEEDDGFVLAEPEPEPDPDLPDSQPSSKPIVKTTNLLYPQSNASLRFRERELGLTILSSCLPPTDPPEQLVNLILSELPHPSMAGKTRTVGAFVTIVDRAPNKEDVKKAYEACVPKLRKMVVEGLEKAGKWSVLDDIEPKLDGSSWKPVPPDTSQPLLSRLRTALSTASQSTDPTLLDEAWSLFSSQPSTTLIKGRKITPFPHPIRRFLNDPTVISDPALSFQEELLQLAENYLPLRTALIVHGDLSDPSAKTTIHTFNTLPQLVQDYLFILLKHAPLRTSNLVARTVNAINIHVPSSQQPIKIALSTVRYSFTLPTGFVGSTNPDNFWRHRPPSELDEITRRDKASGTMTSAYESLGSFSGTSALKQLALSLFDAGIAKGDFILNQGLSETTRTMLLENLRIGDLSDLVDEAISSLPARIQPFSQGWSNLSSFLLSILAILRTRLLGTSRKNRIEARMSMRTLADRILGWLVSAESMSLLESHVASLGVITHSTLTEAGNRRIQFWNKLRDSVFSPVLNTLLKGSRERYPAPSLALFNSFVELVIAEKEPTEAIMTTVLSLVSEFLEITAPLPSGVYGIRQHVLLKDAMPVAEPTDLREPWNNTSVFDFAMQLQDLSFKTGQQLLDTVRWWISVHSFLSPLQRLAVFSKTPATALLDKCVADWHATGRFSNGVLVAFLEMGDGDVRAQSAVAEGWLESKELREMVGLDDWARLHSFLDVSIPANRAKIIALFSSRSFEDRIYGISALLSATWRLQNPKETATTLQFLIGKFRNEIHPNLVRVPPLFSVGSVSSGNLYSADSLSQAWLPRSATKDEFAHLARLWLEMDANNLAAVSEVSTISQMLLNLSDHVLRSACSCNEDSEDAWEFVDELLWKRAVHQSGLERAPQTFRSLLFQRVASAASKALDDTGIGQWRERDEALRLSLLLEKNRADGAARDGNQGLVLIPEGREELVAEKLLSLVRKHFNGTGITSFEDSIDCFETMQAIFTQFLGLRWAKVPALQQFVADRISILRSAPLLPDMPEDILDWKKLVETTDDSPSIDKPNFMRNVVGLYSDYKKLLIDEKPDWFKEYSDLRLHSTEAFDEAFERRVRRCTDDKGKVDGTKQAQLVEELLNVSESALHLSFVPESILNYRQDLLKESYLTASTGIRGVFNQIKPTANNPPPTFNPQFPTRLSSELNQLLSKLYLKVIKDKNSPLYRRQSATEAFTRLPTTTVHQLAELLADLDLPQRLVEAILMFLPSLDEPAAGIQILLSRYYLDSDLARTAINVTKSALDSIPLQDISRLLVQCYEQDGRPPKITVQKELLRLAKDYVQLPEIDAWLEKLWEMEKLHRDVRLVLIQTAISLISHASSEVRESAWKIVKDAATNPSHIRSNASLALCAVTPEIPGIVVSELPKTGNEAFLSRVVVDPNPTLAELARQTISGADNVGKWTLDVLIPLALLPDPSKGEEKNVVRTINLIRSAAVQVLCFAYPVLWFGDPMTVEKAVPLLSKAAQDLALDSSTAGKNRFRALVYLLGECVAAASVNTAPLAWNALCSLIATISTQATPESRDSAVRIAAIQQLQQLDLASSFLYLASPEIRERTKTLDKMELVSSLGPIFWKSVFARKKQLTDFGKPADVDPDAATSELLALISTLFSKPALNDSHARSHALSEIRSILNAITPTAVKQRVITRLLDLDDALFSAPMSPSDRQQLRFELLSLPDVSSAQPENYMTHWTALLHFYGLLDDNNIEWTAPAKEQLFVSQNIPRFSSLISQSYTNETRGNFTIQEHLGVPFDLITPIFDKSSGSTTLESLSWSLLLAQPVHCFARAPSQACSLIARTVEKASVPSDSVVPTTTLKACLALVEFVKRTVLELCELAEPMNVDHLDERAKRRKEVSEAMARYGSQATVATARLWEAISRGCLADLKLDLLLSAKRDGTATTTERQAFGVDLIIGATSVDEIASRWDALWTLPPTPLFALLSRALPTTTPSTALSPIQLESYKSLAAALVNRQSQNILLNPRGLFAFANTSIVSTCAYSWLGWETELSLPLQVVRYALQKSDGLETGGDRTTWKEIAMAGLAHWIDTIKGRTKRKDSLKLNVDEARMVLKTAEDILGVLQRDESPGVQLRALLISLDVE